MIWYLPDVLAAVAFIIMVSFYFGNGYGVTRIERRHARSVVARARRRRDKAAQHLADVEGLIANERRVRSNLVALQDHLAAARDEQKAARRG